MGMLRTAEMLNMMWQFIEQLRGEIPYSEIETWDLSYPLLRMWERSQVSIDGITEDGWESLEEFRDWLVVAKGMSVNP